MIFRHLAIRGRQRAVIHKARRQQCPLFQTTVSVFPHFLPAKLVAFSSGTEDNIRPASGKARPVHSVCGIVFLESTALALAGAKERNGGLRRAERRGGKWRVAQCPRIRVWRIKFGWKIYTIIFTHRRGMTPLRRSISRALSC